MDGLCTGYYTFLASVGLMPFLFFSFWGKLNYEPQGNFNFSWIFMLIISMLHSYSPDEVFICWYKDFMQINTFFTDFIFVKLLWTNPVQISLGSTISMSLYRLNPNNYRLDYYWNLTLFKYFHGQQSFW